MGSATRAKGPPRRKDDQRPGAAVTGRFLSTVAAPFRRLGHGLRALLTALDDALVQAATPFGINITDPWRRYGVLLGVYAAVYLIGALPVPYVPLLALAFGYVGVLAIGRAWVLNEKQRAAIAKKLRDGNPDEMPDLRGVALVSALQILIPFPLVFMQMHRTFGMYEVPPEGANFWTWMLFSFDHYSRALLSVLELYGYEIHTIKPGNDWSKHLILLARLTVDWILIQGVYRLLAIRETVREAVAAVKSDRELAERLGKRAVGPLIRALRDPNAEVRSRAAETLGSLGEDRAVGPLIDALKDRSEQVRERAAKALGQLGDADAIEPLTAAFQDPDRYVKAAAGEALKKLDPKAAAKAGVR